MPNANNIDHYGIFTDLDKPKIKKIPHAIIIPNFLNDTWCDRIVDTYIQPGSEYLSGETSETVKGKAVSNCYFLMPCKTYQLHAMIVGKLRKLARSKFKIEQQLSAYWKQPLFVNEYLKGGYRGWHYDGKIIDPTGYGHPDKENEKKFFTKRLTCVIQLSDSHEYGSGDLRFFQYQDFWDGQAATLRQRGTAIIFLSEIWHQVEKVNWGVRRSLNLFLHEG